MYFVVIHVVAEPEYSKKTGIGSSKSSLTPLKDEQLNPPLLENNCNANSLVLEPDMNLGTLALNPLRQHCNAVIQTKSR
jgi:hypothetical protein